eukprot:768781-Hanusia_phi.AAC.23
MKGMPGRRVGTQMSRNHSSTRGCYQRGCIVRGIGYSRVGWWRSERLWKGAPCKGRLQLEEKEQEEKARLTWNAELWKLELLHQ